MTRRLLRLVPIAALASLAACAPIQVPTASQQSGTSLLAPSSGAPTLIGRIGRPGHYQVGPITAHPSGPVCSLKWYKRGFINSYVSTWNTDVLSAQTSYSIAHGTSTPAALAEMHRLSAMAFAPPDFPPPGRGFFNGTCRSTSDNLGQSDGMTAARQAWYIEHNKLMAEHILSY